MKNFAIIIGVLLYFSPVFSQDKVQRAPLHPDFRNYLESRENGILKTETTEGYQLGYIPSPLYIHFMERPKQSILKSTNVLPLQYDLRTLGFVTPVKNQGGGTFGGNCVAFATMGAIESRLLVLGKGEYNLSEQNTAACYGYLWGYGEGANHEMATAYLSRFSGPVLEAEDPYNTMVQTCRSDLKPGFLVPESRWLPKDNNLIKQTIMDFGGLYCSVHIEYASFNETFKTYYYNGTESGNHAWMVVGWDDQKYVPSATQVGAWIIKNSWGNTWMDTGFVYCSYADSKIMDNVSHWPEIWEKDAVDTMYMYDYLGAVSSVGYGKYTAYGIAKYAAPEEQLVTKIGTFVNAEGSVLDIEIYDDFDEKNLSNLLNLKSDIYVELPGYYTFDLPTIVNGDFYIKVTYYTPGFNFPIPIETFVQDYADPVIDTSVNWISPDNKTWNSCNPDTSKDDEGENLTIRAYAIILTSPVAMFESNKEKVCLGSNVTYTLLENDSVNEFHWNFGEDALPATAETKGPHQVTYSSEGRKTISLIVAGPNGSDTLIRHDYITIVPEIEVIIPEREANSPVEQPYIITAYGADTYEWTPSDYLDKTTGQSVTATPMIPGDYTYVVTGHQGTCSATDTFTLSAKIRPSNDDVCTAYELIFPIIDTFTNRNATVQSNEPAPPEGDCNTPLQWCEEGGLQNSIWFWFTGPATGIVSFDTEGMDNQIAVYRADTCTDILEDNWDMIAANDDYYNVAPYPCALEAVEVETGKKYFVQFDGSAGGAEGEFILKFSDYALGFNNPEEHPFNNLIYIYPNPGTGIFYFRTNIARYDNMSVEVFNLSGQIVYSRDWEAHNGMSESSLDISTLPAGIYQVRVIFGENVMYGKIVME